MIKELTPEEAAQLRELVKHRFQQSPFNGSGFRITQYKEAYQALADDIKNSAKEDAASISTHRLRKFFFYTDPSICPGDKLEKPSFGDDFIRVLFSYVASSSVSAQSEEPKPLPPDGTLTHEPIPATEQFAPKVLSLKWVWHSVAIVLLLVVGWMGWQYWSPPPYWTEEFTNVSVDSLKSRGWEILDYDSVAFGKQLKPGCLTLCTYPGDYWVKPTEQPSIRNLLVKPVTSGTCVITTRLMDFDPYHNWQNAGVFLFGPTLDRQVFFRITFGFDQSSGRPYKYGNLATNKTQAIQIVCQNGKIKEHRLILRYPEYEPVLSEIGIVLEVAKRKITVKYWRGHEWSSIEEQHQFEMELPFTAAYVGLGAFQGLTDNNGVPLGADTLPAFFDYLKVEPFAE